MEVKNLRFRIDLKIFAFLIFFYFTRQIELYALIMMFAIIHEVAHLITGVVLKFKPDKIELIPLRTFCIFQNKH